MTPYYERSGVRLWLGDNREVLPTLEGGYDLVLTDPPYNVSVRGVGGRANTTVGAVERQDGSKREIRRDFGDWDYDWDPAPFVAAIPRLLRDGGSLIAFVTEWTIGAFVADVRRRENDSTNRHFTDEGRRIAKPRDVLDHRCEIYWHKANPTPNFRGLYQRAVEEMVWQTKGGAWTFNANGATHNVYREPIVGGAARTHPTQKPVELMRSLLLVHSNPGDRVLDPFAGSGTTARACKDLGRTCDLIEADERYAEDIVRRMEQEVLAL